MMISGQAQFGMLVIATILAGLFCVGASTTAASADRIPIVVVTFEPADTSSGTFLCDDIVGASKLNFTLHMLRIGADEVGLASDLFTLDIYHLGGVVAGIGGCGVRYALRPDVDISDYSRWGDLQSYFERQSNFQVVVIAGDSEVTLQVASVDYVMVTPESPVDYCNGTSMINSRIENLSCNCDAVAGCRVCSIFEIEANPMSVSGSAPCVECDSTLLLLSSGICIHPSSCPGVVRDGNCIIWPTTTPPSLTPSKAPSTSPTESAAPSTAPSMTPSFSNTICSLELAPCNDNELVIPQNLGSFRCEPSDYCPTGTIWNGSRCIIEVCEDTVTCVAGLDFALLCNPNSVSSESFRLLCPVSCGLCDPDESASDISLVQWGLTENTPSQLCQCPDRCATCAFQSGILTTCLTCKNHSALAWSGSCVDPIECPNGAIENDIGIVVCDEALPTVAPTITPYCSNRCLYNSEAQVCHDQDTPVACLHYGSQQDCPSGRCYWNSSYGCIAIAPPLPIGPVDPVYYDSLRCDQITHSYFCQEQSSHCEWDIFSATCKARECTDIFAPDPCNRVDDCSFDIELLICTRQNDPIPCDRMWLESRCNDSSPRCEWHIDGVTQLGTCHLSSDNSIWPCHLFNLSTCPQRCYADLNADLCLSLNEVASCDSYPDLQTCPTTGTEFDSGQIDSNGHPVCRRTTIPTCGNGYFYTSPTATTDRICQLHSTPCFDNEFEAILATISTDRMCQPVTSCANITIEEYDEIGEAADLGEREQYDENSEYFQIAPATSTSDTICARYSSQCLETQYESIAPQWTSDRVCEDVTQCTSEQFTMVDQTPTSDRICTNATICGDSEFESYPLSQYFDRQCANLSVCTPSQFEASPPVVRNSVIVGDRVCRALTICEDYEFEFTPPSLDGKGDRVCFEVTPCAFESAGPTETSDRVCCDPDNFNTSGVDDDVNCTAVFDRCSLTLCSSFCSTECGWSLEENRCKYGEITSADEIGLGVCPTSTISPSVSPTISPTTAPVAQPSLSPTVSDWPVKSCMAGANAHYVTFDGAKFDWHGGCDYILARDCRGSPSDTTRFEVQVRQSWRSTGREATHISGVAIRLPGAGVVVLFPTQQPLLNNMPVTLPYVDSHGNSMNQLFASARSDAVEIRIESVEATVRWNGGTSVSVWLDLSSPLMGVTCGLCGDSDNIQNNDLTSNLQNQNWIVGDSRPSLFNDEYSNFCEEPIAWDGLSDQCTGNVTRLAESITFCDAVEGSAYESCRGRQVPFEDLTRACIAGHCAESSLACEYFWMVEEQCRSSGMNIFEPLSRTCDVVPDSVQRPIPTNAPSSSTVVPTVEELTLHWIFSNLSYATIEDNFEIFQNQITFSLINVINENEIVFLLIAQSHCPAYQGLVVVSVQMANSANIDAVRSYFDVTPLRIQFNSLSYAGVYAQDDRRCQTSPPTEAPIQFTSSPTADPTNMPSVVTTTAPTSGPTQSPSPPPTFSADACNISRLRCEPDDICSICMGEIDIHERAIDCFRLSKRFRDVVDACIGACPEVLAARSNPTDRSFNCYLTILDSEDKALALDGLSESCINDPKIQSILDRSDRCTELSFSTEPWSILKVGENNAAASSGGDQDYDIAILIVVIVVAAVIILGLAWSMGVFRKKEQAVIESATNNLAYSNEAPTSGYLNETGYPHEKGATLVPMSDLAEPKFKTQDERVWSYNVSSILSPGALHSPRKGMPPAVDDELIDVQTSSI